MRISRINSAQRRWSACCSLRLDPDTHSSNIWRQAVVKNTYSWHNLCSALQRWWTAWSKRTRWHLCVLADIFVKPNLLCGNDVQCLQSTWMRSHAERMQSSSNRTDESDGIHGISREALWGSWAWERKNTHTKSFELQAGWDGNNGQDSTDSLGELLKEISVRLQLVAAFVVPVSVPLSTQHLQTRTICIQCEKTQCERVEILEDRRDEFAKEVPSAALLAF